MIVNIRGTHGSGKSTIVTKIILQYPHIKILGENNKVEGYCVRLSPKARAKALYVVGRYETACGGCDGIQPYELIWPRVEEYAEKGHVIFEGALVSSSVGNIGRAMAARKDCVVCFLDTPVEVCLERIRLRRAARGEVKPLNPRNTLVKFEGINRSKPKLAELGLRCVTINYKQAYAQIMEIIHEGK